MSVSVRPAATLILLAAALAGCAAAPRDIATPVAFDPAAAAFINAQGSGRIDGHAFLKTPGDIIKPAAGEIVRLVPVTPYSQQRFATLYRGNRFVAAGDVPQVTPDADYARFTRTTRAKSSGRFTFDNVAPGTYYVATQTIWKTDDTSILSKGGAYYDTVTLTGKETGAIKLVLTYP